VVEHESDAGARREGSELFEELEGLEEEVPCAVGPRPLQLQQDAMTVDLSPATVVTLYLLPEANMALRPRILSQLRPGARVVSHDYHMDDWPPVRVEEPRERDAVHTIYLWRIGATRPPK